MQDAKSIADHWGKGDVYGPIEAALRQMGKPLDALTVEDLGPVDHFHARGFPATVELADRLPIRPGQHLVDIGCGLGGPARYLAKRFQCTRERHRHHASHLSWRPTSSPPCSGMEEQVRVELGDGQSLPYPDATFDGGYTQHVTMNVADRPKFFAEAFRVLKPGAFFAMTEHGLGPTGNPHHPVPWSDDGSGAYLVTPARNAGPAAASRIRGHRGRGYRPQIPGRLQGRRRPGRKRRAAAARIAPADGGRHDAEDSQRRAQHRGRPHPSDPGDLPQTSALNCAAPARSKRGAIGVRSNSGQQCRRSARCRTKFALTLIALQPAEIFTAMQQRGSVHFLNGPFSHQ